MAGGERVADGIAEQRVDAGVGEGGVGSLRDPRSGGERDRARKGCGAVGDFDRIVALVGQDIHAEFHAEVVGDSAHDGGCCGCGGVPSCGVQRGRVIVEHGTARGGEPRRSGNAGRQRNRSDRRAIRHPEGGRRPGDSRVGREEQSLRLT